MPVDDPVEGRAILGRWTAVRHGRRWRSGRHPSSVVLRYAALHVPLWRKVLRKLGNWSMARKPMYRF